MIICIYKITVSKDNKPFPFEVIDASKFKTYNELEAHRVIKRWNERGKIKNKVKTIWRYDIISCFSATLKEWDNPKIPLHKESDC